MLKQSITRRVEDDAAVSVLVNKLNSLVPLSEEEVTLIESSGLRTREFPSGVAIPLQRRSLRGFVVSGWAGRLRLFADGRRQIVSTMVSGELIGGHPNPFLSSTTVALTHIQISDLRPILDALERQPDTYPRLRRGLALAAYLEELQMAEQIVRLGRRTAFERVAHWLLELQQRLALAGVCEKDSFEMPLTQELLSDILGMSIVHVNRIFKQLRSERLIELKGGYISFLEPERLAMISEFTPIRSGTALIT